MAGSEGKKNGQGLGSIRTAEAVLKKFEESKLGLADASIKQTLPEASPPQISCIMNSMKDYFIDSDEAWQMNRRS